MARDRDVQVHRLEKAPRLLARTNLPVLVYHHVGPPRPRTYTSLTVSAERFERHVNWLLKHRYRALTTEEVLSWAKNRRPLPRRKVLLTFDDGYGDLAEYAFPILEAAGLNAIVFIVTGLIGSSNTWDKSEGGSHRLLTPAEIRAWSAKGIEFGAHSRTHRHLTSLPVDVVRDEVQGSKRDLEKLLGRPVLSFAYPYGSFDAACRRVVAEDFAIAFSVDEGVNRPGEDRYVLRRTMVSSIDGTVDIAQRVLLGYAPRLRARFWLGTMRRRVRLGRA